MRRLHVFLLMLAALSLLAFTAAGCGSDSTPSTKADAVQKCKDEAKKINDANARDAAEKACAGDKKGATDAVKRQCLDQANSLPAGSARDQATAACNKIGS